MSARHILTFAQSLDGGGVESAQLRLAADWLAAGRRVTMILGTSRGPLANDIPPGLRVIERGTAAYLAQADLPRHVTALAPDLLFCPGNHYTCVAAWTRLRLGAACPPIVAKLSNTPARADHGPLVGRGARLWARRHPRFIDHLVTMTRGMADEARHAMGFPADRVSVIANPPARHGTDPAPLRLPTGRFILGIGRLEPQKRWDRLILAMGALRATDAKLVILGEGSTRPALERLIARHGLADRVSLPGHHLDPRPAIRRAAVVALTSDYEGVPGVLREALALGTPVVTTDSSVSIREIVTGPALGDIVAPDDPPALAAALDRWLDPSRPRPAPVPAEGRHAAQAYLTLFDRLVTAARHQDASLCRPDARDRRAAIPSTAR